MLASGLAINCEDEVREAEKRIRHYIRETPIDRSHFLSDLGGSDVWLKLEHLQHTGSFKLRGAMNKILSLSADELAAGVIAASTGNHGMAVSYAARQAGAAGATIYVQRGAAKSKAAGIELLGGEVVFYGDNCLDAENRARKVAGRANQIFISPYNDPLVIGGQGTLGVELLRQLKKIDAVFISVGGGGLIAGVAGYLKAADPRIKIVGCWPQNSRVLYESLRTGQIIEYPEEPTISDSTAGGIEKGAVTFELCRRLIDDHVLVSEEEILGALRIILEQERWIVEGAAGVAAAAYLKTREKYAGRNVVILLCGRNISPENLRQVVRERGYAGWSKSS